MTAWENLQVPERYSQAKPGYVDLYMLMAIESGRVIRPEGMVNGLKDAIQSRSFHRTHHPVRRLCYIMQADGFDFGLDQDLAEEVADWSEIDDDEWREDHLTLIH